MILTVAVVILIGLSLRTGPGRIFFTGQLFDNDFDRYTRSTMWHGDPEAPTPWLRASRAERAATRAAIAAALLLYLVGFFLYPTATLSTLLVIWAMLAAYGIWLATQRWATRHLRKQVIRPLFFGLLDVVGWHEMTNPTSVITAGDDYRHNGVHLKLPPTFHRLDSTMDAVTEIAARTLGGEWEAEWDLVGEPALELRHAPPPPDEVTFTMLRPHMAAAGDAEPVIGLGTGDHPVTLNLESNTPHVLVAGGTGSGKSVTIRTVAAQSIRHRNRVLIIDHKRVSHEWAQGLPGVTYCKTPDRTHAALLKLAAEIKRRYSKGSGALDSFTRWLVVVEELNMTMSQLQQWWIQVRRSGMSRICPSVLALQEGLYVGRQARVNFLFAAQMGSANAFGGASGGAARENIGARILGRYTENQWRMLAPEVTPIPPVSITPGRVQVVIGGEATACQVGYLTDAEARDWARAA